jgi:amidase
MDQEELCYTPATDLARMIRSKDVSPREIVEILLERIDRINPKINAYCTVASEQALQAADEAERAVMKGEELGPLHGVPVSIKDLTPTKGLRTTFGSTLYENYVPDEDALVVRRLKAAGAIVMGKTNTPEFGAGMNATNKVFGTTLNPWDLTKTSGGSSGGAAAALATGLGPLAEGTDLGGSVRIPASFCGVVGFRTTPGLIPRYPTAWAWDGFAITGPMARTLSDTALMLSVVAGPDDLAPISLPDTGASFTESIEGDCKGLRAAWTPDLGGICRVDPEVAGICESAARTFEKMGVTVEEASPDLHDAAEIISPLRVLRTAVIYADLVENDEGVDNLLFKQFLHMIKDTNLMEVAQAERKRTALWSRMKTFFETYDLLLCPTTSTPAFGSDQLRATEIRGEPLDRPFEEVLLTYALTITTLPVISVPAGWTEKGLPVGLQITGRRFAERTVLKAAANLEKASPWSHRRPSI